MATLPNIPVNSALSVGVLAGLTVIAYSATLRHKLDSQIHENYRTFKQIDAGVEQTQKPKIVREA